MAPVHLKNSAKDAPSLPDHQTTESLARDRKDALAQAHDKSDLLAMHPLVRSLSNLKAVIDQLFPATLLARIVTLAMQARRDDRV